MCDAPVVPYVASGTRASKTTAHSVWGRRARAAARESPASHQPTRDYGAEMLPLSGARDAAVRHPWTLLQLVAQRLR